jgi:hypothetical protein
MNPLGDIIYWMADQMKLAMPIEIVDEEPTPPEHSSATEHPSEEY